MTTDKTGGMKYPGYAGSGAYHEGITRRQQMVKDFVAAEICCVGMGLCQPESSKSKIIKLAFDYADAVLAEEARRESGVGDG